jgi:hypothetical protein
MQRQTYFRSPSPPSLAMPCGERWRGMLGAGFKGNRTKDEVIIVLYLYLYLYLYILVSGIIIGGIRATCRAIGHLSGPTVVPDRKKAFSERPKSEMLLRRGASWGARTRPAGHRGGARRAELNDRASVATAAFDVGVGAWAWVRCFVSDWAGVTCVVGRLGRTAGRCRRPFRVLFCSGASLLLRCSLLLRFASPLLRLCFADRVIWCRRRSRLKQPEAV